MAGRHRVLLDAVQELVGEADDAAAMIAGGEVLVDGLPVLTPRSRLRSGAAVSLRTPASLRGSVKLRAALAAFAIDVSGRVALDVGAAAGGFTRVLLDAGAARVYALDAGFGQLLGSLRQDPRVVNLEAVNIGSLDLTVIHAEVGVVTVDVSYLALRDAVKQLDRILLAPGADLIGLVKPMFELRLPTAPRDRASLDAALHVARLGVTEAGWQVLSSIDSPVTGAGGAPEMLLWARRPMTLKGRRDTHGDAPDDPAGRSAR